MIPWPAHPFAESVLNFYKAKQGTTGVICGSLVLPGTTPSLVPTTKTFILQRYQQKLLFPFDNPQQKLISITICFSKSSFKVTHVFCLSS